jgi:outer membrane protein assembly factor BamB
VGEGLVVFGTQSGHVVALHERDGRPAWDFATDGASRTFDDRDNDTTSVPGAPTLVGGSVFVGGRDGFLYALDLASGRERWRRTHDGSSWILSTASDGRRLYVGSGSALIVQAVDPATGDELWRAPTRGAVFAPLALGGGAVVYADFSGTLQALDAATGRALWQFPMGGRSLSAPVVAEGAVFAASDQGVLYAIEGAVRRARCIGRPPNRVSRRPADGEVVQLVPERHRPGDLRAAARRRLRGDGHAGAAGPSCAATPAACRRRRSSSPTTASPRP